MEYQLFSHRHAVSILENNESFRPMWLEIQESISNITEERLIEHFQRNYEEKGRTTKSISGSVNQLLKVELTSLGWASESSIFQDAGYRDSTWRLDFAKSTPFLAGPVLGTKNNLEAAGISIEVGFNHAGTIAWNLLKPVLASELNHVRKDIQTSLGIVIAATESLRVAGGFDAAIGTFESYRKYLIPLRDVLSVPIALIGLEAPKTFKIEHKKIGNTTIGKVVRL